MNNNISQQPQVDKKELEKNIENYITELLYDDVPHSMIRNIIQETHKIGDKLYTTIFTRAFSNL